MSIINRMRKQSAIYWPPGGTDTYGRPLVGQLVELIRTPAGNYRVRWEDRVAEYIDLEGTEKRSHAVVYVPVLPNGGEVEVGGWLWLGLRAELQDETDPTNNDGAYQVSRVDHLPDLRNRRTLRTVYL